MHPSGLFPGLRFRDGGTAGLRSTPPPASSALPGANDLLSMAATATADATVLAAADTGIWRSADGGSSWKRELGGIRAWSLTAIPGGGYAALGDLPLPSGASGIGAPVLATSANGLSWRMQKVAVPASTWPFGSGSGSGCAGAVYKSADGGVTWALLPGSCRSYPLLAVQFLTPEIGFAAGGRPAKFGGGQLVEATTDGGRTWQVRWRTPTESGPNAATGILRLDMLSPSRGWAVGGGCVGGQNGPCPGTVYVTTDGGLRWQPTSQQAIAIVGLGAGRAMAVDDRAQTAAVTVDGGRTWAVQTQPQTISTSAFDGVGDAQFWATNLGDFLSRDGGGSWAAANGVAASGFTYFSWQAAPPARLLGYSQNGDGFATWSSGDGGRTWARSVVPGDAAAGASVLYQSSTGGARWDPSGLVLPFGVGTTPAAAVSGSRIALIDACDRLQLSADDGARWQAQSLGSGMICTVSQLRAEVWLACTDTNPGADSSDGWVLHSADGGSTWLAYRLPSAANAPDGIFATGVGAAVMPVGGSLWRTTDGGRSWSEYWPAL